jgi:ribosome-binding protein aMBF1 (putative translation factor)
MSKEFGNRVMQARKEKGLSREELANLIGTSGPIIGRYERGDMMPSVEIATKIADALEVSLDFLVGKSTQTVKDKSMMARLEDIANLPNTKRLELFNVLDAYIRDFKTSKAYAK